MRTIAHHRRSIRLREYDYTQAGAYFVTICTWQRECLFGEVVNGEMRLNPIGGIVEECWKWLGEQYPYVELDVWVIMPNHIHGMVLLTDGRRGGSRTAPTEETRRKPLGRLIGAFKTVSTKRLNLSRDTSGLPVWQRNYYERVIRDEAELGRMREYIVANPRLWAEDEENPDNLRRHTS